MGSAMATVAQKRGHDVGLWGTWLDDPMLDPVRRGELHPRLRLPLTGIRLYGANELADALAGADLVVYAVNSDGAIPVMQKAHSVLPDVPIVSVTKGFLAGKAGKMVRIDQSARRNRGAPASLRSCRGARQSDGSRARRAHLDDVRRTRRNRCRPGARR
jgi:glycerol-3-phosphate dehydrogenase (NAD(P)+)